MGIACSVLGSACSISSFVNDMAAEAYSLWCCRLVSGGTLGRGSLLSIFLTVGGKTALVVLSGVGMVFSMVSDLFSIWDNVSRAFLVGSPSFNDGTVEDGGYVSSVTVSVAACLR